MAKHFDKLLPKKIVVRRTKTSPENLPITEDFLFTLGFKSDGFFYSFGDILHSKIWISLHKEKNRTDWVVSDHSLRSYGVRPESISIKTRAEVVALLMWISGETKAWDLKHAVRAALDL